MLGLRNVISVIVIEPIVFILSTCIAMGKIRKLFIYSSSDTHAFRWHECHGHDQQVDHDQPVFEPPFQTSPTPFVMSKRKRLGYRYILNPQLLIIRSYKTEFFS